MTAYLLPEGRQRYFNNDGTPAAGGKLWTYSAGTSALKATFANADGNVLNTNPIVLDAKGEAVIFWSGAYKVDLKQADGQQVGGYPVDNLRTDPGNVAGTLAQLQGPGAPALLGFAQPGAGAVARTVQAKLEEFVSVTDYGADDSGAFSTANVLAFQRAASSGKIVVVPPPASSYYLASDPAIPTDVNIMASPDWFSGPGKMPCHKFTAISEGVDPRIFAIKGVHYTETDPNEAKRKWALVGWVYYGNSPDPAAAGYTSDAVGVDGRVVVDAFNGRGWGLLGLAHITAKAFNGNDPGVSQAYACELDVNNNTGHDVQAFDSGPITRGLAVVSGGQNRPAEALYVLSTERPAAGAPANTKDNRWWCGLRFYPNSVHPAGYLIHVGDENEAIFARIPIKSAGIRWTSYEAINYAEYQERSSKRRIMWSQTPGYGYDWINGAGKRIFSSNDNGVEMKMPLRRATLVEATPATIDASKADVRILTAGSAVVSAITNGVDGQRLTLLNASGGTITVAAAANMRMIGGTCALANTNAIEFIFADPTWFETCRSPNVYP